MDLIRIVLLVIIMVCSRTHCLANSTARNIPLATPTIAATGNPANTSTENINIPDRPTANLTDGLNMGDPNAPLKVTEFADFQCPACGNYWSTLEPSVISNYIDTGKIYFTYVPFSFLGQYGSDPNWDESMKAAQAAYCANDQNKFWEYHDFLFANQKGENEGSFSRTRLIVFADSAGLDHETFVNCLDSEKYKQKAIDAYNFAVDKGASFTPSFLINGNIVGSDTLMQSMNDALK
jgi:protein-disulfide isomerase